MVTLLARHGKVVHSKTFGKQDLEKGTPIQKDTIFRIASMTKPITGVAMMILFEEGKWRPEDPIARHVPEFADLKVLGASGTLEPANHPPTMGELMTHTAGFSYGGLGGALPVDKLYVEARLTQSTSLHEFVVKLGKLPLAYQPGTRWLYSYSVDIQGYIVEKLSGRPLPDFMRERIFQPLGMKDTAFHVPEQHLGRVATVYGYENAKNALVPASIPPVTAPPALPMGGGGLFSTPNDYLRFAQMLVNGGRLGSARILAPSTVELMRSNHLDERLLAGGEFTPTIANGILRRDPNATDGFGIAFFKVRPGIGFGYDVGVIFDPARASRTVGKGTYHWDGAFGTWFWVDPTNDLVFVGMIQRRDLAAITNVQELARQMVYQALVDPEK
jgi:CubicO group peptidase (beta-lactamase class C family)